MRTEILKIVNLKKSFGGLEAVGGINFCVPEGELSSVIGPNGAGKSTLFNLISGYHRADEGQIYFKGENIVRRPPYEIVKKGIGRSFQKSSFFPGLSVLENIEVTLFNYMGKDFNLVKRRLTYPDVREKALEILAMIGLNDKGRVLSNSLAHGDKKKLDMGIVLATHSSLLLLDEPTAGMSQEERIEMVVLIKKIAKEIDLTVILIEHDMDVVFSISETIRVMHQGRFIAEGNPEEISKNESVRAAYLGE